MAVPAEGLGGPARIRFEHGRIDAVEAIDLAPEDPARRLLALPAPINAHDHGRGLRPVAFGASDDRLETWVPALAQEPRVDPYLRAAAAFARMAEGGAGAANHCHNTQDRDRLLEEAKAVSQAARDVGLRIAFAVPIMNRNPMVMGDIEALFARLPPTDAAALRAGLKPFRTLSESVALVEAIAAFEHDLFQVQFHPIAPQWVDDETLATIARLSEQSGRRVHMHLFETRYQREWADAAYPEGLIRRLDDMGLLSPRLSLAHGVWLKPDECELLAARGVILSVNPSSNLRLGSGAPAPDRMHAQGLGLAVGLDGMSFDDDEDILRETRLFARLARGVDGSDGLSAPDVFDSLCLTGRRALLGEDGGGRIVPGAPADILTLDIEAMIPDRCGREVDPMGLLMARMSKRHVRSLVVAGRQIVKDQRCVSVDLPGLEAALWLDAKRSAAQVPVDRPRLARQQDAIADFYRCGCHRGAPATSGAS